ncbi:MAG TPA: aminopeptidase N [Micromonosporaceae bacterium]
MPQGNLTRAEAQRRAEILHVHDYAVEYDLTIGPDRFGTTSTVRFDCAELRTGTFLDLLDADVSRVTLNGRDLDPAEVYRDGRIHLDDLAAANVVTVVATCPYRNSVEGMNRYIDPADGEVYIYSKFEPAHARRAYACFEQPDLKAAWQVDVVAPAVWEVNANMPATDRTELDGGRARCSFAPTPRLATYLTAIVAGPFHIVRDEHRMKRPDGSDVTIPMALGCRASMVRYLDADGWLRVSKDGLDFYVERFGHAYPFEKYDQFLVPEYSGAMEQPGAVIFGDMSFLFRSAPTDAELEMRAFVILHEMAHMWFGDLVTMRWWDDLWLNESFAEYAGALATAESSGHADVWATYAGSHKVSAATADQLPTTHPVVADVPDLASVDSAFDRITYEKGASVLKQLAAWVGPEAFAAGVRDHFTAHAWGNATVTDFLDALGGASGRDMTTWAAQWLHTSGVNTMRADFAVDGDGRFTAFAIEQTGSTLRDHRMAVGCYDEDETGGLRRSGYVLVDVSDARTEVPELIGVVRPALLLLNDDDLTYTKIRLDDQSLATGVGSINDPVARALVWSAAWDMCRDGEMAARDYVAMVLAGIDHETLTSTVDTLLDQCSTAIFAYADPAWTPTGRSLIASHARERLAAGAFPVAWLRMLAKIAVDSDDLDYVRDLLDGTVAVEGVTIEGDLRWFVIISLAAAGHIDAAQIDSELADDPTSSGSQYALAARAALATPEDKAAAWRELAGCTSIGMPQVLTAYGFNWPGQVELQAPYVQPFLDTAQHFLDLSDRMGRSVVAVLYPGANLSADAIDRVDAFLLRDDVTPMLRRLIVEGRDGAARAVRARARDASA